jgi:dTDP-4-amino-4,6-dideoxygalactose transaminase
MKVPFLNLQAQQREISRPSSVALRRLLTRGDFILGQDVADFETAFARYIGVRYALGVNSGTDALFLSLKALGVGPGDEVIVPTYTYIATAFAVTYTGATPVFVDIDPATHNIDPSKCAAAVTQRTKALLPVHLYGQAADMNPILKIARSKGLAVLEDAAQAHGTLYRDRKVGALGDAGAFSFYPTKNLGATGDAGMITTNDAKLFERLRKLRDYGRRSRYEHESLGYNSRLDSIQAVYLKEKLKRLDRWNDKRRAAAAAYTKAFRATPGLGIPAEAHYGKHVYHIYAVRVAERDRVLDGLKEAGIGAMVHYPVPVHLQQVYASLGYKQGDCPAAEALSQEVLCLPIHPHITRPEIAYVVKTLKGLVRP